MLISGRPQLVSRRAGPESCAELFCFLRSGVCKGEGMVEGLVLLCSGFVEGRWSGGDVASWDVGLMLFPGSVEPASRVWYEGLGQGNKVHRPDAMDEFKPQRRGSACTGLLT